MEGEFGIRELKSEDWSLEDVKLSTELAEGQFVSQNKIKRIELKSGGDFYRLVRPLFLDEKGLEESLVMQKVSGRVQFGKDTGSWDRVSATALGRVVLSSSGKWLADRSLEGTAFVDFPVLKLLRWDISGNLDRLQIQPSAKMLKELARRHPEIRPPGSMEFVRTGDMLVKEISSQSVEKLKTIGQKVIETARKIIPEGTPTDEAKLGPEQKKKASPKPDKKVNPSSDDPTLKQ